MKKVKFSTIRRRNQTTSFLVFLLLVVMMGGSFIVNPWYKIPINWYFIPVLGVVGALLLPAFFGRHYCGQYCPTGFIADSMNYKSRAGKLLKTKRLRWLFVLLMAGIFVAAFLPWNMGLPKAMTTTYWQTVMSKLWILWLLCPFAIALPLVVLTGMKWGGRTWCNYLCPWGAIGVSLGKNQLKINNDCDGCKKCMDVCSQPEVLESVVGKGGNIDGNCLVCLNCVDVCPKDAIEL